MFSFGIELIEATFISRPNRFLMNIEVHGKPTTASVPNPGKMQELLYPQVRLLVTPMDIHRVAHPYRVIGLETIDNEWILIDTHRTNDVAEWLIRNKKIGRLTAFNIKKREVTVGKSRFDFELEDSSQNRVYCEVKSVSLFYNRVALFPDAVTTRGSKHIQELSEISKNGVKTVILFLIQSANIDYFLPNYHTDPVLAENLYLAREHIDIIPFSIGWNNTLELENITGKVAIPWEIYEKQGRANSGLYLILLSLSKPKTLTIGSGKKFELKEGYYIYVGSAKVALSKRVERHKRTRKKFHWHIDYIRNISKYENSWQFRNPLISECELAQMIQNIANSEVVGFGASDCRCNSHLFYFKENPTFDCSFQSVILSTNVGKV